MNFPDARREQVEHIRDYIEGAGLLVLFVLAAITFRTKATQTESRAYQGSSTALEKENAQLKKSNDTGATAYEILLVETIALRVLTQKLVQERAEEKRRNLDLEDALERERTRRERNRTDEAH